jgi:hypothetical protein
VSLSTDDPPVLTALAPGHATITAGGGSADVTVSVGPLPIGTVIWSNLGDGSGVDWIVPAVPSPTGVADVFAFQHDGTIQAITSDGTVAWTTDVGQGEHLRTDSALADFQGGLLYGGYRLDGITGQASPGVGGLGLFPDGTILDTDGDNNLVGTDPTTGAQEFSVPYQQGECNYGTVVVAGDGYAYIPFSDHDFSDPLMAKRRMWVVRVNSSGASDIIDILSFEETNDDYCANVGMITNADQGILFTWLVSEGPGMAIISGGVASRVNPPQLPYGGMVFPELQAQDGSFVGSSCGPFCFDSPGGDMIAFDASGAVRWVVPNDIPQVATADGGVIGQSGIIYDQNGNATGQLGTQLQPLAGNWMWYTSFWSHTPLRIQSWTGNQYVTAGAVVSQVALAPYFLAVSFWPEPVSAFAAPGVPFIPIDSVSNYAVNGNAFGLDALPPLLGDSIRPHDANASANGILSHAEWNKFKQSHCAEVFALGIPPVWHGSPPDFYDPTLQGVQKRQSQLNFYDTGNPYVANLKLSEVTNGLLHNPVGLYDYLANLNATAATPLFGRPGPIVLRPGFFNPQTVPNPQFILIHEVLLHAYAGLPDDAVYAAFANYGLWNDKQGSTNISTWMSTDCRCTPGHTTPGAPTCQANTAPW